MQSRRRCRLSAKTQMSVALFRLQYEGRLRTLASTSCYARRRGLGKLRLRRCGHRRRRARGRHARLGLVHRWSILSQVAGRWSHTRRRFHADCSELLNRRRRGHNCNVRHRSQASHPQSAPQTLGPSVWRIPADRHFPALRDVLRVSDVARVPPRPRGVQPCPLRRARSVRCLPIGDLQLLDPQHLRLLALLRAAHPRRSRLVGAEDRLGPVVFCLSWTVTTNSGTGDSLVFLQRDTVRPRPLRWPVDFGHTGES